MNNSRILVVDDSQTNLQLVMQLLHAEGYDLAAAVNGEQGLQIAQSMLPDLILLDVMMPDLDGFTVCQRLKAMPQLKDVPVIFLTARTDQQSTIEGLQMGAVDYVHKPFSSQELLARVRTHLELFHARNTIAQQQQALQEQFGWFRQSLRAGGFTALRVHNDEAWIELQGPSDESPQRYSVEAFLTARQADTHPEDWTHLAHLLREQRAGSVLLRRLQDDQTEWEELRLLPTENADVLAGGIVGVDDFIQRSVELQAELEDALQRQENAESLAEQSARLASLGEVAASIAHELKSPLAAMHLKTQMLQQLLQTQGISEDSPMGRKLRDMLVINDRAGKLLQQIRDFARDDNAGTLRPCSLQEVLDGVHLLVSHSLMQSNINLQLDLAPDLPKILGRIGQLEQVFVNLFNNARDAMEGRDIRVLTVHARAVHGQVEIEVSDTGHGIPRAVQARLFESFFTTKERGKGTGLGLSLVRRLIDEHNGKVSVRSTEGVGTTFIVSLPQAP